MNLSKSDKTLSGHKKKRYEKLDLIRGITLISMITYHTCWDLVWLYGKDWSWYRALPGYLWQQSICWTFILLSGFCWSMGRRKMKRGLQVLLSSCLVTIVTIFVMPEDPIWFGVLTFMGCAMLLMIPIEKAVPKKPIPGILLSFALFFLLRDVNNGYLGFEQLHLCSIPVSFYRNWFTTWLGFPFQGFYSADYFAIIPWFGLFLTGYYLYHIFQKYNKMDLWVFKMKNSNTGPVHYIVHAICWAGSHTLILYLLHQIVIYIVLMLIFL